MFDEKSINLLTKSFTRICALPITSSTFKEMQQVLFVTFSDKEKVNKLISYLLGMDLKEEDKKKPILKDFIDEFGIYTRLARDVLERGDFISFISSDLITPDPQHPLFVNLIRRVDGELFRFVSEVAGIVHLVKHFLLRLEEVNNADKSKTILNEYHDELKGLKEKIEQLVAKK